MNSVLTIEQFLSLSYLVKFRMCHPLGYVWVIVLLHKQKKPKGAISNNSEFDNYLAPISKFDDNSTGKEFPMANWWHRHKYLLFH